VLTVVVSSSSLRRRNLLRFTRVSSSSSSALLSCPVVRWSSLLEFARSLSSLSLSFFFFGGLRRCCHRSPDDPLFLVLRNWKASSFVCGLFWLLDLYHDSSSQLFPPFIFCLVWQQRRFICCCRIRWVQGCFLTPRVCRRVCFGCCHSRCHKRGLSILLLYLVLNPDAAAAVVFFFFWELYFLVSLTRFFNVVVLTALRCCCCCCSFQRNWRFLCLFASHYVKTHFKLCCTSVLPPPQPCVGFVASSLLSSSSSLNAVFGACRQPRLRSRWGYYDNVRVPLSRT